MAIINKPYTFVALTTKTGEAAQVNADFDNIYTEFNGNISDANIAALANINQSKILNLPTDLNTIRTTKVGTVSINALAVSGTYTKPSGLLFAKIICIGGGGGGGGAISIAGQASAGGGGGGGAYTEAWVAAASILPVETVTIGAAGTGGFGLVSGTAGGTTSFGGLVSAAGGFPGSANTNSIGSAGSGGFTSGILPGSIGMGGQDGYSGMITTSPAPIAVGGNGGSLGPYQIAGRGFPTTAIQAGGTGTYGGGGGGASSGEANSAQGGSGGNGLVLIVEFRV